MTDHDQSMDGRVIEDRYRIVEHLGEGGMGAVYIAEDTKLRKRVALKIIRRELLGDDEVAGRFEREALVSAQIEHPNIATALDYGRLPEGGAYIILQLVKGQSLSALLSKRKKLTWPEACEIAAQVADALAAAHAKKIIHRDLKPDNVLLERRDDGGVMIKVLDFGIARVTDPGHDATQANTALTRVGTVMGTPGYMAPEQAMGEVVDGRADLYALGVVLWEMIVGEVPFAGPDLTAIVTRQLTETLPTLGAAAGDPSVPASLNALVASLLARQLADRPVTVADVRDALRDLAYGSQSRRMAIPSSAPTSFATGTAPTMAAVAPKVTTWVTQAKQGGRARTLAIVGAASVVGVLVIALAAATGDDPEMDKPRARLEDKVERVVAAPTPREPRRDPPPIKRTKTNPDRIAIAAPASPEMGNAIAGRLETLLRGEERRDRDDAAEWIRAHAEDPGMPAYAVPVADLQLESTCRARKDALERIRLLDDPGALPAVERMQHQPRSGCGFLSMSDCISCIRRDLAQTAQALRD